MQLDVADPARAADGTAERPPASWRGDIQGLRAVAVLLVVVCHAGLGLAGGYTGVDVFFVISGFLISQLLFREAATTGHVSLLGFYARRARRILPAATVVLVATLVASTLWVSKAQAVVVGHDAWWAALFAANLRFAHLEVDYFAQGEATSPLQHYWSLSVEEQFYLVWPLLLLVCLLVARRRRRRGLPRPAVAGLLVVLTAASLVWSVRTTADTPQTAYFSTPARAWELGIGALVALLAPAVVRRWHRGLREVVAAGGLVLVAVAAVVFDDRTPMPGTAALLPVAGAALVLLAGASPTSGPTHTSRVLSTAPMRRIGDWSYSIYLWHWPLLLVPRLHAGHDLGRATDLGLALLSIPLAALTYRYVETPFRSGFRGGQRRLPAVPSVLLYPASLALVGLLAVASHQYVVWSVERGDNPAVSLTDFGVPDEGKYHLPADPRLAIVEASVIAARHHMALPSHLSPSLLDLRDDVPGVGDCEYWTGTRELCPRGDPDGARTMVVLGDSHGRMWIPALDRVAADAGYRAYFLVLPRCNPGHMVLGDPATGGPLTDCTDFNDWAMSQIAELRPDTVVVSSAPVGKDGGVIVDGQHLTDQKDVEAATRDGYADLFHDLASYAGRTVLIADVPQRIGDTAECLTTGHPDLGTCAFTPQGRADRMRKATVAAADASGVQVVDPQPWLCWDHTCAVVVGSTITYRDSSHLSGTYAAELAPDLGRALALGSGS